MIDQLGSPSTYNHYPTGWAVAFSTPFRMFKRYSYQGGVCDPLVISWPARITARGEVRSQYHHSVDIYPTILEACGVEMPEVVNGHRQSPLSGISMSYTFEADGPTRKQTQYYEMLGTRGIWHQGWKAVAEHGPFLGKGRFDEDRWQLFHTDTDRSEAHDLADRHPDKLEELKALWFEEARANNVLPLSDLGATGEELEKRLALEYHVPVPPSGQYTYYPGTTEVPEHSAANTKAVSFKILAEVDFTSASQGVIVAQGSRFGGYSLFVKDGTLTYAYNFIGIPPETRITAPAPRSGRHIVGVEFTKERIGERRESHGPLRLYIDDQVVAEAEIRTMTACTPSPAKGCASATTAGTRSAPSTPPSSSGAAARSTRSSTTSPTTPTSTSSATSPPPSPRLESRSSIQAQGGVVAGGGAQAAALHGRLRAACGAGYMTASLGDTDRHRLEWRVRRCPGWLGQSAAGSERPGAGGSRSWIMASACSSQGSAPGSAEYWRNRPASVASTRAARCSGGMGGAAWWRA